MRILHITSHLGGGLGSVIMDWVKKENAQCPGKHEVLCLDYANEKAKQWADENDIPMGWNKFDPATRFILIGSIEEADIVVLHFYDHPMIYELLSLRLPPSRMVAWCHKNFVVPKQYLDYPDLFLDTSPIQNHGRHIWSTGDMSRFLALEKKDHEEFNIGTVASPKLHPAFMKICKEVSEVVLDAHFVILGEAEALRQEVSVLDDRFTFCGKVDDVAPYLAEMDVFLYPLRSGHWGTAEQALGEAMTSRLVPVVFGNCCEKQIIRDYDNGRVVINEQDMILTTRWLCYATVDRKTLEDRARNSASVLYDHGKMISQWNQVFETMMKSQKTLKEPVAL